MLPFGNLVRFVCDAFVMPSSTLSDLRLCNRLEYLDIWLCSTAPLEALNDFPHLQTVVFVIVAPTTLDCLSTTTQCGSVAIRTTALTRLRLYVQDAVRGHKWLERCLMQWEAPNLAVVGVNTTCGMLCTAAMQRFLLRHPSVQEVTYSIDTLNVVFAFEDVVGMAQPNVNRRCDALAQLPFIGMLERVSFVRCMELCESSSPFWNVTAIALQFSEQSALCDAMAFLSLGGSMPQATAIRLAAHETDMFKFHELEVSVSCVQNKCFSSLGELTGSGNCGLAGVVSTSQPADS